MKLPSIGKNSLKFINMQLVLVYTVLWCRLIAEDTVVPFVEHWASFLLDAVWCVCAKQAFYLLQKADDANHISSVKKFPKLHWLRSAKSQPIYEIVTYKGNSGPRRWILAWKNTRKGKLVFKNWSQGVLYYRPYVNQSISSLLSDVMKSQVQTLTNLPLWCYYQTVNSILT